MLKQSRFIVLFITIAIGMTVGYTIYDKTINTEETASLANDFDVSFYEVGNIIEQDCYDTSANISANKNNITINVPNLSKVGSYAIIPITIKNNGNVKVKLKSLSEYSYNINNAIGVFYSGMGASNAVLNPGETNLLYVRIEWLSNEIQKESSLRFLIKMNYEQVI